MHDYKICIPRGTHERLLAVAVTHKLDIPIGQGGPNIYHISRERLRKTIKILDNLDSKEVKTLINELNYYDEQSQPPPDRLFRD